MTRSPNTVWYLATVTYEPREAHNAHKSRLLWLIGLSGAGKSTLEHAMEEKFHHLGYRTFVLDGDNVTGCQHVFDARYHRQRLGVVESNQGVLE